MFVAHFISVYATIDFNVASILSVTHKRHIRSVHIIILYIIYFFSMHPVYYSLPQDTDTRGNCRHVRLRCAPFSVTGERGRWWREGCLSREFSVRTRWPVLRLGLIPNKNMRDILAGRTRTFARERTQAAKREQARMRLSDDARRVFCFRIAQAKYLPRWIVGDGGKRAFCLRLDTAALLIASMRSLVAERRAIAINRFRFRITCVVSDKQIYTARMMNGALFLIRATANHFSIFSSEKHTDWIKHKERKYIEIIFYRRSYMCVWN